jgi:predicted nucleic acid-binding protein
MVVFDSSGCCRRTQSQEHAQRSTHLVDQPSQLARNPAANAFSSTSLAEELAADLLLVDVWDARLEAERRHLRVVGTLSVLADGASRGLNDLEESCYRLRDTNFRVNSELLESLLEERRRRPKHN